MVATQKYQLLPPLSDEEYNALKMDIAARGVLVPVECDENGNILDGYHRVKACEELGIKEWPRIVRIGLAEDEKVEHVLKLNVHRRHLPKEWKQQKALELRQQGWSTIRIAAVLGVNDSTVCRWLEISGSANAEPANSNFSNLLPETITGRDGKQYPARKKHKHVYISEDDVRRVQELPADLGQAVLSGRKRLEDVERKAKIQRLVKAREAWVTGGTVGRTETTLDAKHKTDPEIMADLGYEPQVFTIWRFNERDKRFGVEYPGNIPAGVLFNVLYYWTEQGDLVIDPMAGGGVTIDVCKAMKRRCLAWDVNPVRKDVEKHDVTQSWPTEPESASLVFLDPPYWKQKRGKHKGENNLADLDLDKFYAAMETVFRHARKALKSDGVLAVIVGPTQENGIVHDHALAFAELIAKTGYAYINRVIVPYTTQQVAGFNLAQARRGKFLLKLHRDLLVFKKMT